MSKIAHANKLLNETNNLKYSYDEQKQLLNHLKEEITYPELGILNYAEKKAKKNGNFVDTDQLSNMGAEEYLKTINDPHEIIKIPMENKNDYFGEDRKDWTNNQYIEEKDKSTKKKKRTSKYH